MNGKTLLLVSGAAALMLAQGCGGTPESKDSDAAVRVKVVQVGYGDNSERTTYLGTVQSTKSTNILCPVPGTLKSLNVSKGHRVREGEVVAVVSSESVQSSLDVASAMLSQAEDGYSRMMQLYSKGGVTEVKKKEVETQLQTARASYNAARKLADACVVKAPFSGTVEDTFTQAGVDLPLLAPIARLLDPDKLEVQFKVPEADIRSLSEGMPVDIEIPALDLNAKGRIEVVEAGGNSLTHAYSCTAKLDERMEGLRPSMAVKVHCRMAEGARVLSVPPGALFTDFDGRYVWVVRDGTVYRQEVRTGAYTDSGVIISEGLAAGDLVIVQGARKVCSSMKVLTVK